MLARTARAAAAAARSRATAAPLRLPALARPFSASPQVRAASDDFVQSIYVAALRAYKAPDVAEASGLPESFAKPAAPATPPVEQPPPAEYEEGEIVLVRAEDFPAYRDPAENPDDFDPWWDYTVDNDYPPYSYNRPHRPPTELHEA